MKCNCNSCILTHAADVLINAGLCPDIETACLALQDVVPYPSSLTWLGNLSTLKLIAGFHGATIYKMLLARKSSDV